MASATLKPPPRFVTNEWAWAHTLDKLREKDHLDDGGNPRNYGEAVAIYKNVAKKYGDSPAPAPSVDRPRDLTRSELFAADGAVWVIARGHLVAANDDSHMLLTHTGGYGYWQLQRYTDEGMVDGKLDQDTAEWLVRDTPAALELVLEAIA